MDFASVLGSVHRDRLSLEVAGGRYSVPPWADWLIWLGEWMRCQSAMGGRRVVLVRVPTRRLAAAFVGLGALFAASRLHDDSLDWNALQALPRGTKVHWRGRVGEKSKAYTGTTDSPREIGGNAYLALTIEARKGERAATFLLPRATALSYGVTLGAVTNRAEERLSAAASLIRAVVDGASLSWIRSLAADSLLVTERSSFVRDVEGLLLNAGHHVGVPLLDVLATTDTSSRRHGKLQLISLRAESIADSEGGITVLDGAIAATRLGNLRARSIVLLLEHPEYDDEVVNAISPFVGYSVDAGIHLPSDGMVPTPDAVEAFAFGLPETDGDS